MNSIVRFSLARFFSLMEIPWRFHVTNFISLSGGNFLRSLRFVCLLMFLSFLFSSDLFAFPLLVGPGFGCTVSSVLATIVPVWRALAETGPRGPSPSSWLKRCFGFATLLASRRWLHGSLRLHGSSFSGAPVCSVTHKTCCARPTWAT